MCKSSVLSLVSFASPTRRPGLAEEPKFLVDEMLQRLGRWLRAAGYDTVIATDAEPDYYLLRQAIDEGRILVTRDRELSQHRSARDNVILLECDALEDCARELSEKVSIDWQHQPFTRCMVCNTPMSSATSEQIQSAPEDVRDSDDAVFYCPQCRQVFWDGSHVKRMQRHLDDWKNKYTESSGD
jgi:uncharacterized protein with PIN domain